MYTRFKTRVKGLNLQQTNKLKGNGMQVFAVWMLSDLYPITSQNEITIKNIAEEHKRLLGTVHLLKKSFFLRSGSDSIFYDPRSKETTDKIKLCFDMIELNDSVHSVTTSENVLDRLECVNLGCLHQIKSIIGCCRCGTKANYKMKYCPTCLKRGVKKKLNVPTECPKCGDELALVSVSEPGKELFLGSKEGLLSFLKEERYVNEYSLGALAGYRLDSVFFDKSMDSVYIVECKNKEFTGVSYLDALSVSYYVRAVKAIMGKNVPLTLIYNGKLMPKAFAAITAREGVIVSTKKMHEVCNEYCEKHGTFFKRIIIRKKRGEEGEIPLGKDGEYCVFPIYSDKASDVLNVDIERVTTGPPMTERIARYLGR